jgi:multiple sugar transport system substrate-binding protein
VTKKALNSDEYADYLNRAGEDNKTYYRVKIEASRLLMEHTGDTFVTPVFNGSASLRSAAGQLIENTVKGARRKQEMNDAFIEQLYSDVKSLYRLDQIGGTRQAQPIPLGSKILLGTIAAVWILIGVVKFLEARKKKTKQ